MNGNDNQILVVLSDIRDSVARLPKIEARLDAMDAKLGSMDGKLDALIGVVTQSVVRRIDDHERRLRRLEARLETKEK